MAPHEGLAERADALAQFCGLQGDHVTAPLQDDPLHFQEVREGERQIEAAIGLGVERLRLVEESVPHIVGGET